MDGFQIKKRPQEFVIPEGSLDQLLSVEELSAYEQVAAVLPASEADTVVLYILPLAFQELNREIHWRTCTSRNLIEQGGILAGKVFRDSEGRVCGVVEHIIPSIKSGTATYIQFSHDDWIAMYREFDEKYATDNGDGRHLQVIGWYHTHPNMPVNMSVIDKSTHINFFSKEWQFSVIFNPQRGIWSVFNGDLCANCCGIMFCPHIEEIETDPSFRESETFRVESDLEQEQGSRKSFVIQRRSDAQVSPQPVRQSSPRVVSGNGSTSRQKQVFSQTYVGKVIVEGRTCYYCPVNAAQLTEAESYMIGAELVQAMGNTVKYFYLLGSESMAFVYYLTPGAFITKDDTSRPGNTIRYRALIQESLIATRVVYHTEDEQFLEYSSNSCKDSVVPLAVVFSQDKLPYQTLLQRYKNCSCVLWIDPYNTNLFEFYAFDSRSKEMRDRFSITNMKSLAQRFETIEQGENPEFICRSDWTSLGNHSQFYRLKPNFNQNLLNELLKKVKNSFSISSAFCIIFDYDLNVRNDYPRKEILVLPFLNQFKRVTLLKQDVHSFQWITRVQHNNAPENEINKSSQFAFIVSNRNINSDIEGGVFWRQFFDYKFVVSVDIETRNLFFYRL